VVRFIRSSKQTSGQIEWQLETGLSSGALPCKCDNQKNSVKSNDTPVAMVWNIDLRSVGKAIGTNRSCTATAVIRITSNRAGSATPMLCAECRDAGAGKHPSDLVSILLPRSRSGCRRQSPFFA